MDQDIDKKLNSILAAINGLEARIARIEARTTGVGGGKTAGNKKANKKTSIGEFLLENPPPDHMRRTLAVGYFMENHDGLTSFTKAELEKVYREAKEPVPSNISVNIAHCIKHGHMMEAQEKKNNKTAYVVTRSGEQFVVGGYKKSGGK